MARSDFWKEFRPVLLFLGKFLILYISGNVLYGFWIESLHPAADPATLVVTRQVAFLLNVFGEQTSVYEQNNAYVTIVHNGEGILSVFEGCNGINVVIVYLSFILSFRAINQRTIWFAVLGIIIIHLSNLLRIIMLYIVSSAYQQFQYFVHKYLFTGFIYGIVLLLWILWIRKK